MTTKREQSLRHRSDSPPQRGWWFGGLFRASFKSTSLQSQESELKTELRKKEEELDAKDKKIANLVRDIFLLNDNRPDATRDDRHYEIKFSNLFRKIDEWVVVHYQNAHIDRALIGALHERVRFAFSEAVGQDWENILRNDHISVLCIVCISQLLSQVVQLPLLGLEHDCTAIVKPKIESSLKTGSEASISWRTTTISLFRESPLFWKAFQERARSIAAAIVEDFVPFAPTAKIGPRTKKLTAIIEDAGRLGMECQEEPSLFRFEWFPPGVKCGSVARMISDMNGSVSDKELATSERYIVAHTIYPAVIRIAYKMEQDVVIAKAKVLLETTTQ